MFEVEEPTWKRRVKHHQLYLNQEVSGKTGNRRPRMHRPRGLWDSIGGPYKHEPGKKASFMSLLPGSRVQSHGLRPTSLSKEALLCSKRGQACVRGLCGWTHWAWTILHHRHTLCELGQATSHLPSQPPLHPLLSGVKITLPLWM